MLKRNLIARWCDALHVGIQAGLDLPAWTVEELAPHALVRQPVESLEVALNAFGYAQRSFIGVDAVRRQDGRSWVVTGPGLPATTR